MNVLQRFFRWCLGSTKKPFLPLPSTSTTILEWRSSEVRVDYAKRLFSDPTFQEMIGALNNSAIAGQPITVDGKIDGQTCALELGRVLGRQEILAALNSMRVLIPKNEVKFEEPTYPNPTNEE